MRTLPILIAAAVVTGALAAQTRQRILTTSKDNTLYFDNNGTPSNGAGTRMFCGNTGFISGGLTRRAVMAFDVAAVIPAGSTITGATLQLTHAMGTTGGTATLHRLARDWGEGTSFAGSGQGGGAPPTPGDATWQHTFFPNQLWQTAGGDFANAASGSTTVGFGANIFASTAAMVADVQAWLDTPAQNFGWLLRGVEQGMNTATAFSTKEDATPARRPALVIDFTPPPARVVSTGVGCTAGGANPLTLGAVGVPSVPNPAFALTLAGGPAGPAALVLTQDLSPVPIPISPGCFVYVNPLTLLITLPAGPSVPLPVPDNGNLIGASLSVQAAQVNGTTFQLATSNALTLVFGS